MNGEYSLPEDVPPITESNDQSTTAIVTVDKTGDVVSLETEKEGTLTVKAEDEVPMEVETSSVSDVTTLKKEDESISTPNTDIEVVQVQEEKINKTGMNDRPDVYSHNYFNLSYSTVHVLNSKLFGEYMPLAWLTTGKKCLTQVCRIIIQSMGLVKIFQSFYLKH